MISASSAKRGVAWIKAEIVASILTSSTAIVFDIRAWICCTAAGTACSRWVSSLACISFSAWRALTIW